MSYLLLRSLSPNTWAAGGRALETSTAITPASSLTAVEEGVVAVTWIPWKEGKDWIQNPW